MTKEKRPPFTWLDIMLLEMFDDPKKNCDTCPHLETHDDNIFCYRCVRARPMTDNWGAC